MKINSRHNSNDQKANVTSSYFMSFTLLVSSKLSWCWSRTRTNPAQISFYVDRTMHVQVWPDPSCKLHWTTESPRYEHQSPIPPMELKGHEKIMQSWGKWLADWGAERQEKCKNLTTIAWKLTPRKHHGHPPFHHGNLLKAVKSPMCFFHKPL